MIPLWTGAGLYKSNGFFLLEPSIMSQFAALGLVVEFLYFGSLKRLSLLAAGLLTSFSGTGMLVLGVAVVVAGFLQGSFMRIGKLLVMAGFAATLAVLVAPEYAHSVTRRVNEFNSENSSGFIRLVSPYLMVRDVFTDPRALLGFGPGTAERFKLGYEYGINALTKPLVEYGPLGFISYVGLMVSVVYRSDVRTFAVVGLIWFVIGGGYILAPFAIYTLFALLAWAPESDDLALDAHDPVPTSVL